ncbi:MAG: protein kinase [Acidobacteriota bacterium]
MTENAFTILLVDDNEFVVRPLARFLTLEGFIVIEARDGEEALRRVEEDVDLVILDVMMPGMSGLEVLRRLREGHSEEDLVIVMATASVGSEQIIEAFECGASDYITKPLDFPIVLARLHSRLRSRIPRRSHRLTPTDVNPWSTIKSGAVLDTSYRLDAHIGRGNFAEVYEATHVKLDRKVAVKLLRTGGEDDAELRARFLREGRSTCRIEHPNAVSVLDASVTPEGVPFLVTELLAGDTLEALLKEQGDLTPSRCAEILLPVCDVLAEAHSLGIVHRDIKPHNIFLHQSPQGEVVKVLDFGIAKLIGDSVAKRSLTLGGVGPGTPAYMAPERFASEQTCDGKADVYSLGVLVFKMLTGELPFAVSDGNLIKLALMHQYDAPPSLRTLRPELPDAVAALVQRALEKDPDRRPSARELAAEFAAALGLEVMPKPAGSPSAVKVPSSGISITPPLARTTRL